MLCDSMKKIDLFIADEEYLKTQLPPPPGTKSLNYLLRTLINEKPFFSTEDSTHLVSQYTAVNMLRIDEEILQKANITSFKSEILKEEAGEESRYYTISLPLFSLDGTKAFVQVGCYCGFLCGYGKDVYLQKEGGQWRVVESYETWIS